MPIHDIKNGKEVSPASIGGGNGGGGLEARLAKVEAAVEHTARDIQDIKLDVREMRNHNERDFRLLFTSVIVATLGLAGLLAKGFGWL